MRVLNLNLKLRPPPRILSVLHIFLLFLTVSVKFKKILTLKVEWGVMNRVADSGVFTSIADTFVHMFSSALIGHDDQLIDRLLEVLCTFDSFGHIQGKYCYIFVLSG